MQESVSSRISVSKKGMICIQSNGHLHQKPSAKGGKGNVLLRETHAFCARNMGAHVQPTSLESQMYEKRDKKLDSRAAKKGTKKIVSSNFAKILEYESSN
jgi:hypothetical protein